MKPVFAWLLLTCGSVATLSAQSAGVDPVRVTLEDAFARGLSVSHRLEEAGARREVADALVAQRRAVERPQVAALAGYTRTNHVDEFGVPTPNNQLRVIYPDLPDNFRSRLDVQWPLYNGGRTAAAVGAARSDAAAAGSDADTVRADLRFEIARAFWTLVVADESVRVVRESLNRMAVHVRDVQAQLDAGVVPPNDLLTAQAQQSRQRMLSIQAESSRQTAEGELARLIDVQPGTPIEPVATSDAAPSDPVVDTLIAAALAGRAERASLKHRITAAEERHRGAASGRLPAIVAGGGIDYANPNPRIFPRQDLWKTSWDASVNLSWALFDGGRMRADLAEAAAARRVLEARLAEFDAVLAQDVRQRVLEITSARAAVEAADDALAAAREAERVVGERFAAGVLTSTDVVDARVATLQAGLDRTQAVAAVRLAEARLRRALGQ